MLIYRHLDLGGLLGLCFICLFTNKKNIELNPQNPVVLKISCIATRLKATKYYFLVGYLNILRFLGPVSHLAQSSWMLQFLKRKHLW